MSMESAVAFYEKLEDDLQLQERIKGVSGQEELAKLVKDDLGYEFTPEEMQKVVFERNPEMTDEELEAVVGGMVGNVDIGLVVGGATVGALVLAGTAGAAGFIAGAAIAAA